MNSKKKSFKMDINNIQPSQLYISKQKLAKVKQKITSYGISTINAIPVKKLKNTIFYTDGHTRAFAAYQVGLTKIPVIWEDEELDWEMYETCIKWCEDLGLYTIADLSTRVIDQKDYEIFWYKRCDDLHKKLALEREQSKTLHK
ncbi:MAG: ParB/RepB/Spo0J family partition protein [Candidatus Hodarchaeota archaeon]